MIPGEGVLQRQQVDPREDRMRLAGEPFRLHPPGRFRQGKGLEAEAGRFLELGQVRHLLCGLQTGADLPPDVFGNGFPAGPGEGRKDQEKGGCPMRDYSMCQYAHTDAKMVIFQYK